MAKLLIFLAVCSLRLPSVETFKVIDWQPEFTETSDVEIADSTIGILTHCSQLFDPLRETAPAIGSVVRQLKAKSFPVLYLHDKYNPSNPDWNYLYSDWSPTAYVSSDVGHIDINLSAVNHSVCLGGFYEQCERSTVSDIVRLWQRDGADHDMRITQVTDGIFAVHAYLNSGDRFEDRARAAFRRKIVTNRKAVMTLAQTMHEIIDEELFPDFLRRQLSFMPSDVNVVMDVYGVVYPIQIVSKEVRTLTFAYRTSDRFLEFRPPTIDFDRVRRMPVQRSRQVYPSSPYPMASGQVIYSEFGVPVEVYSTPFSSYPSSSGTIYSSETVYPAGTVIPSGTVYPSGTVFPSNPIPSGSFPPPSSGIIYSDAPIGSGGQQ